MNDFSFETLLHEVTVNSKDNGECFLAFDRINAIKQLLAGSAYHLQKEGALCLLYSKSPLEGRNVVVVSSHIDCVYNHCFCVKDGECYQGTFDNSFTNAAVLQAMLEDRFDSSVVVAFTGDEEFGSNGCLEAMRILRKQHCRLLFAVVTDVTNAGWEEAHPFTIENDQGIDLLTAHHLVESIKEYEGQYKLVHNAEPDESWDYMEQGVPCLSLCVPVEGELHGERGVRVRSTSVKPYVNVLVTLTNAIP